MQSLLFKLDTSSGFFLDTILKIHIIFITFVKCYDKFIKWIHLRLSSLEERFCQILFLSLTWKTKISTLFTELLFLSILNSMYIDAYNTGIPWNYFLYCFVFILGPNIAILRIYSWFYIRGPYVILSIEP